MQEHDKQKALNTPGGDELFKRLGGPAGLPYFAFLDRDGNVLANSFEVRDGKKSGNIGYPNQPKEVDWFMTMLAKSAPAMTADERGTIESWLRHPPK